MSVSRTRLLIESLIVGVLGLLAPLVIQPMMHVPNRAMYVLVNVLWPGAFFGPLVGTVLDVTGFTTDWSYLRKVEDVISTASNYLLFAATWAALRGLEKASTLRRVILATVIVWIVVMIPFFAFASAFMTVP